VLVWYLGKFLRWETDGLLESDSTNSGELPLDIELIDVIETMSDGLALFDAEERLQIFNARYKNEIWPQLSDILVPGVAFETIIHTLLERNIYGGSETDAKFLAERGLDGHRELPSDFEFECADGRWIRQRKQATKSGGVLAIYTDITASKHRETDLKQSEMRLVDAQRLGRLGDWERNLQTDERRYSAETYRMFGFNPSKAPSYKMFIASIHPDDRDEAARVTREPLETGQASEATYRVCLPDGSINVIHSRIDVEIDEFGKIIRTFGTVQDITEQAATESSLRESEESYRRLFEASPIAMLVHNPDQGIVFANTAAAHLYGAESIDELIGIDTRNLVHPDDRAKIETRRAEVLDGVRPSISEYSDLRFDGRRLRLNGSEFMSESRGILISWDDTPSMLLIIRDISERIRAEAEKESQRLFLETLVKNIPARVTIKDREGRYEFVSVGANHSNDEATAGGQLIGQTSVEVFGEQANDQLEKYTKSVFETGEPIFGIERTGISPPDRIYVSNFVPIRGVAGDVESVLTVSVDITDLKQAEEKLHQSQKMEAVGQLTGGVAHEFNNLLMVIVGNLEMTLNRISDETTEGYARTAMKSALRGGELTRQLLAFSRKQDLMVGLVGLNDLVSGMRDMMQLTLGETVSVQIQLSHDVWPIIADAGQLESALLNLALNARDAMPRGGTISIRTENRSPGAELLESFPEADPGEYVMLEIADTGEGMSPEILEQVFDPFFSTKDVGQGTGLGLSMVRGFVEQSGGCLEIDSESGKGTTVRIYLPRTDRQSAVPEPEEEASRAIPRLGATVLVVEDDPDVRELVVLMLSDLECNVLEAADGAQAVSILEQRHDIDVLFSDVVLPGPMSGPDIADAAQRLHPDIKVAFTSGYPDGEFKSRTANGQQPKFISKPYKNDELAEVIASVLGS
jgi:PAS domain S-box-containing protein